MNQQKSNPEVKTTGFFYNKFSKKQKNWFNTGLFLFVVLIFFVVNNSNGDDAQGPYPPNYISEQDQKKPEAPAFVLPTIDNKQVSLADYKGKIVILDFWATWCGPCRRGIPDLVELKKEFGDEGVEIIGISVDGITRDGSTVKDIEPFVKEMKINYPIALGDFKLINSYGGIRSIPTSFIINREGKLVARYDQLVAKETYVYEIIKLL